MRQRWSLDKLIAYGILIGVIYFLAVGLLLYFVAWLIGESPVEMAKNIWIAGIMGLVATEVGAFKAVAAKD